MKAPRFIGLIVLALVLVTAADDAIARNVTLVLKDGRRINGELVAETGDDVTVKVAGIETTFPRDQVADLQVEMTLTEQFTDARGKLKDEDYNGRYELARRMFDTKSTEGYKLSLGELESILQANPEHQMAKLLRNVVTERLKLQPDQPDKPLTPPTTPEGVAEDGPVQVAPGVSAPRELTKDEINLIKVYELRIDSKPNVVVPRKVIDEILEKYQNHDAMADYLGRDGNAKFRNLKGIDQLAIMFDLQAREYYSQVTVRDEPENLIQFGQTIHRQYVIGYCGKCHGEGRAPGYYVVTRPATSENTKFTNLLLLRRTQTGALPLTFRADPSRSPLIQFGLPRKDAGTPHPDVKGLKHYYTGVNDPRYIQMRDWIATLYGETEDYPIQFTLPQIPNPNKTSPAPAVEPKPDAKPATGTTPPPPPAKGEPAKPAPAPAPGKAPSTTPPAAGDAPAPGAAK